MTATGSRFLRITLRLLWLAGELTRGALHYVMLRVAAGGPVDFPTRARWLQVVCRRTLRVFAVQLNVRGRVPRRGLLVSNHLGYLDILVLAAITPCLFVAKAEVRRWPVVGGLARFSGTVFVHRGRRTDTGQAVQGIEKLLRAGVLVVLFPEGTSTGGEMILPFRSSLLEPAVRTLQPVTTAFLRYSLEDGDAAEEVCYWKDMNLATHLVNLLGKRGVDASVMLRRARGSSDRKRLARRLHAQVLRSHHACADEHLLPGMAAVDSPG